jgi:hypothetical protein
MNNFPRIILPFFIVISGGCNFTPKYQAPEMEVPRISKRAATGSSHSLRPICRGATGGACFTIPN